MKRGSGILMHISSLPSPYGIGTMGKEAYTFVDFLQQAGQSYWQILPVGPTSYGDSPYQSFSTFAGNPYFIDLDLLCRQGALRKEDYAFLDWGDNREQVDYQKVFELRHKVLHLAWERERGRLKEEVDAFRIKQAYWVETYAMYMALKFENGLKSYQDWDESLKLREPQAMADAFQRLHDEISFWVYVQYCFFRQWEALKDYAKERGIQIIGDIPIYVAEDSADAWAHDEVLWLDERRRPVCVAGCPPDYFAPKGQLWGNPLYDWKELQATAFEWWVQRIKAAVEMYDWVRIDHFRAFDSFYSIPYGREDAVEGKWMPGPGNYFFDVLKAMLGEELPIIAEDLGDLTEGVRQLLRDTGFPGMKVLQFGFTPGADSEYLPHNHPRNTVAYLGTHDNDTLMGWLESVSEEVRTFARDYMRLNEQEGIHWGFIKGLMASPADTAIVTVQDLLGLDGRARMNTPSTLGDNWQWRLASMELLNQELARKLCHITKTYSR